MVEYHTVEFGDETITNADDYARRTARVDDRTKDPENLIANKAASRLSERAVAEYLGGLGYSVVWSEKDAEVGSEAAYDVLADDRRIDVKVRYSADNGATANLMPARNVLNRADETIDAFVMVWVSPDFSEARIYGAATPDYFRENSETFFGVRPPADRLCKEDLQTITEAL